MFVKRRVFDSVTVTCEAEAYLDDFDEEAIVEYLRDKGYHVSKSEDAVDDLRYPQGISEPDRYITEFCKLNHWALVGIETEPQGKTK